MKVTHVNQVLNTDFTFIRFKHGFVHLTAIIGCFSRRCSSPDGLTPSETYFNYVVLKESA